MALSLHLTNHRLAGVSPGGEGMANSPPRALSSERCAQSCIPSAPGLKGRQRGRARLRGPHERGDAQAASEGPEKCVAQAEESGAPRGTQRTLDH